MIKSRDSKEIRLKEFSYALGRMESLKSGNELTNKIVETQGTRIYSKGDSVPEEHKYFSDNDFICRGGFI